MLTELVTKVKDKNKKKYTVQVLGPESGIDCLLQHG